MKRNLVHLVAGMVISVLLCLGMAVSCAGCASAKANSQKTLASIQLTKDAAMKAWGAYVVREQARATSLPDGQREAAHARLLERRLAVDAALTKFAAAWQAAWRAANYDNAKPATAQVLDALAELQPLTTP